MKLLLPLVLIFAGCAQSRANQAVRDLSQRAEAYVGMQDEALMKQLGPPLRKETGGDIVAWVYRWNLGSRGTGLLLPTQYGYAVSAQTGSVNMYDKVVFYLRNGKVEDFAVEAVR